MENPYQSPAAAVVLERTTRERPNDRLDSLVSGQKHAVYAVLLYFLLGIIGAAGLRFGGLLVVLTMLLLLGMGFIGVYRIARGLGCPLWLRILLLLLLFVPLVGLLVLASLNARATRRLRDAGYEVGLLGARNY